jgi:hypothetical protein
MALGEFRRRFGLLSSDVNARPGSPVTDERRAVEDMLLTVDVDPASYRVGQSQVSRYSSKSAYNSSVTLNRNWQRVESRRVIRSGKDIINDVQEVRQIVFNARKLTLL